MHSLDIFANNFFGCFLAMYVIPADPFRTSLREEKRSLILSSGSCNFQRRVAEAIERIEIGALQHQVLKDMDPAGSGCGMESALSLSISTVDWNSM
jgi:hypothetical protein